VHSACPASGEVPQEICRLVADGKDSCDEELCRVFVLFNFPALFASLLPGAGTDAILHSLDASSYKGLSFVVGMREGGTKLLKFVFWHKYVLLQICRMPLLTRVWIVAHMAYNCQPTGSGKYMVDEKQEDRGHESLKVGADSTKRDTSPDFLACIPQVIESHWDNVWAPRLAGFPVNIVYAERIDGIGLAQATYVFDPDTFVQDDRSKQMRYRPAGASDFSVLIVLHRDGRIETFKYRGSELIREASGPDFQSAMVHTTMGGLVPDEPWTTK